MPSAGIEGRLTFQFRQRSLLWVAQFYSDLQVRLHYVKIYRLNPSVLQGLIFRNALNLETFEILSINAIRNQGNNQGSGM